MESRVSLMVSSLSFKYAKYASSAIIRLQRLNFILI